jgi:hypothetical protein
VRLVTNASPWIFLAKIDVLSLLSSGFSQVLAPPAVVAETGLDLPDVIECGSLSEVGDAFVRGAVGTLHRGELEAMVPWHASRRSIWSPSTTRRRGPVPAYWACDPSVPSV